MSVCVLRAASQLQVSCLLEGLFAYRLHRILFIISGQIPAPAFHQPLGVGTGLCAAEPPWEEDLLDPVFCLPWVIPRAGPSLLGLCCLFSRFRHHAKATEDRASWEEAPQASQSFLPAGAQH